jgi:hypothetical protein
LEFTDSVAKAYEFLSKLVASGGDDGPEDICGGFNIALS